MTPASVLTALDDKFSPGAVPGSANVLSPLQGYVFTPDLRNIIDTAPGMRMTGQWGLGLNPQNHRYPPNMNDPAAKT